MRDFDVEFAHFFITSVSSFLGFDAESFLLGLGFRKFSFASALIVISTRTEIGASLGPATLADRLVEHRLKYGTRRPVRESLASC